MFQFSMRRYLSLALVLALVLVASFGSSGHASAAGETNLGNAIAIQNANTARLMAIDGVIGTAVGRGGGGGHVVIALTTSEGVKGIPGAVGGVIVRPYDQCTQRKARRRCRSNKSYRSPCTDRRFDRPSCDNGGDHRSTID